MLEITSSRFFFKSKEIWFSEVPFEITGYDSVIFYCCTKDIDIKGFSKEEFTTLVIDLTQDLDQIWEKMGKSSCRRSIDRAKKDGVVIRVNQDYDTFLTINSEFRKSKGLPEYNLSLEYLKKNGILFTSEFQGRINGGVFFISDDKNLISLLTASKRLEESGKSTRIVGDAHRMIIWEAIKYAKEKGMTTFDMGGYYTGKEPDIQKEKINEFKKPFGGELVTHYTYQKDYSRMYFLAKWGYIWYNRLKYFMQSFPLSIKGKYPHKISSSEKDKDK